MGRLFLFLSNSGKYNQYLIENAHGKDNTLLKKLASLPASLSQASWMSPVLSPCAVWNTQVLNVSLSSVFCLFSLAIVLQVHF